MKYEKKKKINKNKKNKHLNNFATLGFVFN